MTDTALAAASLRRRLITFAAGVLRFHLEARHQPGIERMLRMLTALEQASDEEVTQATPRLAALLQAETGILACVGEA